MTKTYVRRRSTNLRWPAIIDQAAKVVSSYSTGVTLRQLFYQLVARQIVPNEKNIYDQLSRLTAAGRREGTFPPLIEGGRPVHQVETFESPDDARRWVASIYRRDRTEGQPVNLILGVEKTGIVEQLKLWFEDLGVPIVATSGYASETLESRLGDLAREDGRDSILIYAGDFRRRAGRPVRPAGQPGQPERCPGRWLRPAPRLARSGRTGRARPERPAGAVSGRDRQVLGRRRPPSLARPRGAGARRTGALEHRVHRKPAGL